MPLYDYEDEIRHPTEQAVRGKGQGAQTPKPRNRLRWLLYLGLAGFAYLAVTILIEVF